MKRRLAIVSLALLCGVGLVLSCQFAPDLSRFESCGEDDTCPQGFWCLTEARRCLPDCGPESSCVTEPPPEPDAGPDEDGGVDGGVDGGTETADAGIDGGVDAGMDASVPPLTLLTERLPLGVEQMPYTTGLQVQGGTPPYQFRATDALPEWLAFDGGTFSGTPPKPGNFQVAVEVSDTDNPPSQRSASYSVRVRPQLRVAGPAILVDGYPNKFYAERISATGGIPPYSFKVVGGTFPPGLTLLLDGSVTGTPDASGNHTFQVQVTDSDPDVPQVTVRTLTLSIMAAPLLAAYSTESLPDARVGTSYQYVLRAIGTSNPTWKIKAGALPGGIGFDPASATLTGAPNLPGNYSVTFNVAEGLLTNLDRTFTISVY